MNGGGQKNDPPAPARPLLACRPVSRPCVGVVMVVTVADCWKVVVIQSPPAIALSAFPLLFLFFVVVTRSHPMCPRAPPQSTARSIFFQKVRETVGLAKGSYDEPVAQALLRVDTLHSQLVKLRETSLEAVTKSYKAAHAHIEPSLDVLAAIAADIPGGTSEELGDYIACKNALEVTVPGVMHALAVAPCYHQPTHPSSHTPTPSPIHTTHTHEPTPTPAYSFPAAIPFRSLGFVSESLEAKFEKIVLVLIDEWLATVNETKEIGKAWATRFARLGGGVRGSFPPFDPRVGPVLLLCCVAAPLCRCCRLRCSRVRADHYKEKVEG
jgi:hypothetical protein